MALKVDLVGGFNPSEKYARQIGSFPQVGMNIPKYLKLPPRLIVDGFQENLWCQEETSKDQRLSKVF